MSRVNSLPYCKPGERNKKTKERKKTASVDDPYIPKTLL